MYRNDARIRRKKMMRDDLYNLMNIYEPEFQYRWNDVIHEGFDAFLEQCSKNPGQTKYNEAAGYIPSSRPRLWRVLAEGKRAQTDLLSQVRHCTCRAVQASRPAATR